MSPKVSILIPTYNGHKYIQETIDSCLNQTHTNVEVVVIDDGSSDNTRKLLTEYSDKINLIFNSVNLGFTKNINKLVRESTGDYLIFLGHDDILSKEHVAIMLSEFEEDIVAVHCNSILINAQGDTFGIAKSDIFQKKKTKKCMYYLSLDNFISSCGMMHRKDIFTKLNGWDEQYLHYGEWLYYIRALEYGDIKYTTKTKAYYRRHETNITNTFQDKSVQKTLSAYQNRCKDLAFSNYTYNKIEKIIFNINRHTNLKTWLRSSSLLRKIYQIVFKRNFG
jgi:glycosyltransferase involved in cell wall biosynthesis